MDPNAYALLLPEITEENRPYWDGCDNGELRLQVCDDCGTRRFPDSPVCPACLSNGYSWHPVSGRGTLWSFIVMHQRYFEAFADELPYLVAYVHLDEGPFMMSTLVEPPADLRVNDRLEVVFAKATGRGIPKFRVVR